MATEATSGDDVLTGTKSIDVIDGGAGDDIINSGAGNDVISGGEGDDALHAGAGDDTLDGGVGDDTLVAGGGDDTLTGGTGDDTLNGGGGVDTFKFSFNFVAGSDGQWALSDTDTMVFTDGITQNDLNHQYADFINGVITDIDGDGLADDYTWLQNSTTNPLTINETPDATPEDGDLKYDSTTIDSVLLSNNQTRYYETTINTYEWQESTPSVTSDDGHDIIVGFNWSEDKLDFDFGGAAIDIDTFDAFFKVSVADADGDGFADDTVLALEDDSWSVAIQDDAGAHTLQNFYDNIFAT